MCNLAWGRPPWSHARLSVLKTQAASIIAAIFSFFSALFSNLKSRKTHEYIMDILIPEVFRNQNIHVVVRLSKIFPVFGPRVSVRGFVPWALRLYAVWFRTGLLEREGVVSSAQRKRACLHNILGLLLCSYE